MMGSLERLILARVDEFLRHVPASVWERLIEPMTWSEDIGGEEIEFEVEVLEKDEFQLNIGVGVLDPRAVSFATNFFVERSKRPRP